MQDRGEIERGNIKLALACSLLSILLFLLIPGTGFEKPQSTIIQSSDGRLIGAHIASDGQWRFPEVDSLPEKYVIALVNFEDRWFFSHPGINPISIFRSLILNLREKRIISGGSTISMQVARLSGDNPPRTVQRKVLEMLMALKLELLHSKDYILSEYASNAPFGGNVVGIEAASWRYFARGIHDLSWSEAALLAVLPNAPSLIYPGKNDPALRKKRNRLLETLLEREYIDSLTYSLAREEELPEALHSLPRLAPLVTDKLLGIGEGKKYTTTIDYRLQERLHELASLNMKVNALNEVHNIAALIVEVETGYIVAYAGNIASDNEQHGGQVDMISAPRSTGSILKPLLYAGMLEAGELLPDMLVRDVPVEFSGYSPKNFDLSYSGAVKASAALSRSLNIPAVEMLREYSPDRFLHLLNNLNFTTFTRNTDHYGLTLILGGGEAKLLELTGTYSRMAYVLKHYDQSEPGYPTYLVPDFLPTDEIEALTKGFPLSAGAIWSTFEALQEVNRPSDFGGWKNFSSSGNIAWKTGTSFGFRDAWALGVCPDYAIGVWAGNADGEGRTGLTGVSSAAPLLFDIFELLNPGTWFEEPLGDLMEVEVCEESGHRASPLCVNVVQRNIPLNGAAALPCPYHMTVHLSKDESFRVSEGCYPSSDIVHSSWFILPPAQEWYYRPNNPDYKILPPILPGCEALSDIDQIELLYPRNLGGIYVPVENDGKRGRVVFEAAHRIPGETLFWHLDEQYITETSIVHQLALNPDPGEHILTIMDTKGNSLEKRLVVIEK